MGCLNGFGALALSALLHERAFSDTQSIEVERGMAGHGPHHPVRAKNVIFLYMDGGPSQVDTFDPKHCLINSMAKIRQHCLMLNQLSSIITVRF